MDLLDFSWKPEQGFEQGSQGTQAASMEEKSRQVRTIRQRLGKCIPQYTRTAVRQHCLWAKGALLQASRQLPKESTIIIPILQLRILRSRDTKQLT